MTRIAIALRGAKGGIGMTALTSNIRVRAIKNEASAKVIE